MKFFILILFLLLSQLSIANTGFINKTLSYNEKEFSYQVYIPSAWNAEKKWPVILFLHGAGERGEDGLLQTEVGIGSSIRSNKALFTSIVVMPQCHKGKWWSDIDMEKQALLALDKSIREYNGNTKKIYLTGLSMGGYGTWNIATKYPEKFAAIVPVSARSRPPEGVEPAANSIAAYSNNIYHDTAQKVAHLPIWMFHGEKDQVVPVSESRNIKNELDKLQKNQLKKAIYTELSGMPHNIWSAVYSRKDLYQWLFSQTK